MYLIYGHEYPVRTILDRKNDRKVPTKLVFIHAACNMLFGTITVSIDKPHVAKH